MVLGGEIRHPVSKISLVKVQKAMLHIEPDHKISFTNAHVVVLCSISELKSNSLKNFEALMDLLEKYPPLRITILVGGYLRRYNFWQSKKYNPSVDSIPDERQMEKEAMEWENLWVQEHQSFYEHLERTFNARGVKHFQVLKWQNFLKLPNYQEIHHFLTTHRTDSNYTDAISTLTLQKINTTRGIHPAHLSELKERIEQYHLEESVFLSRRVLDCDYLIYPDKMSSALSYSYSLLNEPNIPCRWLQVTFNSKKVPEKSVVGETFVGFSKPNLTDKNTQIKPKRYTALDEQAGEKKQGLELKAVAELMASGNNGNTPHAARLVPPPVMIPPVPIHAAAAATAGTASLTPPVPATSRAAAVPRSASMPISARSRTGGATRPPSARPVTTNARSSPNASPTKEDKENAEWTAGMLTVTRIKTGSTPPTPPLTGRQLPRSNSRSSKVMSRPNGSLREIVRTQGEILQEQRDQREQLRSLMTLLSQVTIVNGGSPTGSPPITFLLDSSVSRSTAASRSFPPLPPTNSSAVPGMTRRTAWVRSKS